MRHVFIMFALLPVAACDLTREHPAADSIIAAARAGGADTAGMPMHTMPSRAVGSGTMMEEMRATMRAMQTVNADSLHSALPMHRQMASDMLAQMNKEMADMKMPADARWSGLMDSLRQDLARMLEMSAGEVATIMPAHHGRLTRLMDLHHERMLHKPAPVRP